MNERNELKRSSKPLQENILQEEDPPYVNNQGDIIVPANWRDDDDDLSDEEYQKLHNDYFL